MLSAATTDAALHGPLASAGKPRLVLNRGLQVEWKGDGPTREVLEVRAPVRGEALRRTTFRVADEPSLVALLLALAEATPSSPLALPPAVVPTLVAAGVLLEPGRQARPVRFAQLLDWAQQGELPSQLVEDRRARRAAWGPEAIVSPSLALESAAAGRADGSEHPAPWLDRLPVAWVVDAGSEMQVPVWLGPEQHARLAKLSPGQAVPDDFTAAERAWLADAGLVQPRGYAAAAAQAFAAEMAVRSSEIADGGFTVLRDLLPPLLLEGLRRYYAALVAEGHAPFDDTQSARFFAHSEPIAVWMHALITPLVARVVASPIRASYVYFASYVPGAVLERHTDREQCEYTLSLTLDASPDARRETAWPLSVVLPSGEISSAQLGAGDALLFKGRELPHFRERLEEGRTSTSLFFHFVPASFAGSLV